MKIFEDLKKGQFCGKFLKMPRQNQKKIQLPCFILEICQKLRKAHFEVYVVGGAVRDFLMGRRPFEIDNWDLATNAKPEEIQKIFEKDYKTFYENKFGTVTVIATGDKAQGKEETKMEVEITPYRLESRYSDKRHPDKIRWAETIEEDLARRDFTINALALVLETHNLRQETKSLKAKSSKWQDLSFKIIDPFEGQKDLQKRVVRAVGDPKERFDEDALRMLRAVRFAACLNFKIEPQTWQALCQNVAKISFISQERIREELTKIVMCQRPDYGFELLRDTGLLRIILPELEETIGVTQSGPHHYTVFQHSLVTLRKAADKGASLEVRLAALFHDIGKPQTKKPQKGRLTFYAHQVVGAAITRRILRRLKFSQKTIDKVTLLVKNHMFYYDVKKVTPSGVRRLLRRVGPENIHDLIALRVADRLATPVPKAKPYKLRHLEYMMEKVSQDPISVKQLKVDGHDVMEVLSIKPGPRVGLTLKALLAEVLDDPQKNKKSYLKKRIKALGKLSDQALYQRSLRVDEEKYRQETILRQKYWIHE